MSEQINLQKISRNCLDFTQFAEAAAYAAENPQRYLKNEKAKNFALLAESSPTFNVFREMTKEI